jgi:hypothetical protein
MYAAPVVVVAVAVAVVVAACSPPAHPSPPSDVDFAQADAAKADV